MELITAIITVMAVIMFFFFFKKPIRKVANFANEVVETNLNESRLELIQRNMEVLEELEEEFGNEFVTSEDLMRIMTKKRKKNHQQQPVQQ